MPIELSDAKFKSLYRQLDAQAGANHPFVDRAVVRQAVTLAARSGGKPNALSKAEEKKAVRMVADGFEVPTLSTQAARAEVRAALVGKNPNIAHAEITISNDMSTLPKEGRRIAQFTARWPIAEGSFGGTFGNVDIGVQSPNAGKRVLSSNEKVALATTGRRGATSAERKAARATLEQYFGFRPT